jgi:lycopene beta-cyclase
MGKQLFDMAFLGAGCSSYQLLYQLSKKADWSSQKIALFSDAQTQQRSWCFWSKAEHPLQHLVKKSWSKVRFVANDFATVQDISPYKYHYIPGESFFNYFENDFLKKNTHIDFFQAKITDFKKENNVFELNTEADEWQSKQVFSSLPPNIDALNPKFLLLQHFKGWFIKTEKAVFDESIVTLMDFAVPQQNSTQFIYILPLSDHEALVEMTVFSPTTYSDATYDELLGNYMKKHFETTNFKIENTEKGAIPMTDARFSRFGNAGEILLGTAAGMVKSTTGYAFQRITKDSEKIAEDVAAKQPIRWSSSKGRFRFYDRLLLGIITEKPQLGSKIFETLFEKTPMTAIFKFLDEETNLWEEIKIFSRLPFFPFLQQIYRQW